MDINAILLDLEIIKQIKENEKLAIHIMPGISKLFVDNNVYFSGIKRWYNGYNREDSIKYLEDLLVHIDSITTFIIKGTHIELSENLKNAIKSSIPGLTHLKQTYNDDSITVAKIILIINKLNKIIEDLENIHELPSYKEMENISLNMMENLENKVLNNNSDLKEDNLNEFNDNNDRKNKFKKNKIN